MNCRGCYTGCELHNVPGCTSCHKHEGECSFGDCLAKATEWVMDRHETRHMCSKHVGFGIYALGMQELEPEEHPGRLCGKGCGYCGRCG